MEKRNSKNKKTGNTSMSNCEEKWPFWKGPTHNFICYESYYWKQMNDTGKRANINNDEHAFSDQAYCEESSKERH